MEMAASLIVALLLATVVALVHAAAGGAELKRWCGDVVEAPERSGAAFCTVFVQGFLGGADAGAKMAAAQAVDAQTESFSDRATRTRLTREQLQRARAPLESYCLDDDASAAEVVERIAPTIEALPDAEQLSAGEVVHRALVHHFPCKP